MRCAQLRPEFSFAFIVHLCSSFSFLSPNSRAFISEDVIVRRNLRPFSRRSSSSSPFLLSRRAQRSFLSHSPFWLNLRTHNAIRRSIHKNVLGPILRVKVAVHSCCVHRASAAVRPCECGAPVCVSVNGARRCVLYGKT